jgi:hypothetical protein
VLERFDREGSVVACPLGGQVEHLPLAIGDAAGQRGDGRVTDVDTG